MIHPLLRPRKEVISLYDILLMTMNFCDYLRALFQKHIIYIITYLKGVKQELVRMRNVAAMSCFKLLPNRL